MSQSTQKLNEHVTGKVATTPYETLRLQMMQRRNDFALLLGKNVDKFIQVALNAVTKNPELLNADRASLFFACKAAATDKLMPDGKDAVFNVYNTRVKRGEREVWVPMVQYLPMVRGLIKLLWDTDLFTMIDAAAVYEKDHFKFTRGDDPRIEHTPYAEDDDPGPVRAAYLIAKMKTGEVKREVIYRRDIEKARGKSKTASKGPWVDWYDQMAIKTVIHRGYKQLPGVPDDIEGVFERDMAASMAGGFDTEVLQLPETAGGEPVPPGASAVGSEQADLAMDAAPAGPPEGHPANETSEPANAPGASQEAPDALALARAALARGDIDEARDLVRNAGPEVINAIEAEINRRKGKK